MLDFIKEQIVKPEVQTNLLMIVGCLGIWKFASTLEVFQIKRDPSYYQYDFADKEPNVQQNTLRKP